MMIIKGNKVILEDGKSLSPGYIITEGDSITYVSSEKPTLGGDHDFFEADLVCAGFIDIHTHGVGGTHEMLEYWLHDYTFKKLPKYGCTSVLATVTYPKDYTITRHVINTLKTRVNKIVEGQTVVAGIHSEGPIVSDCGGLPHSHADSMSVDTFKEILQALGDDVKVMTISPSAEAKCDYARLKLVLERGIIPAFGHDKSCTEEEILGALRVCAQHNPPVTPHTTHLFNVSSFQHRLPSLANFGILKEYPNEEKYQGLPIPTIEVIGDLVHVSSLTIAATLQCRSPQHVAFITDAVMDHEGESMTYSGNQLAIKEVVPGRKAVVLENTSTIAGSCTTLLHVFHNLVKVLRVSVEHAVQMLSDTPAKIAKLDKTIGSIKVGKRADILLFDANLAINTTIIAGKIAYQK